MAVKSRSSHVGRETSTSSRVQVGASSRYGGAAAKVLMIQVVCGYRRRCSEYRRRAMSKKEANGDALRCGDEQMSHCDDER